MSSEEYIQRASNHCTIDNPSVVQQEDVANFNLFKNLVKPKQIDTASDVEVTNLPSLDSNNTHKGNYVCKYCHKEFSLHIVMEKHKKKHLESEAINSKVVETDQPEKYYDKSEKLDSSKIEVNTTCHFCDKKYGTHANMLIHLGSVHYREKLRKFF